MPANTLRAAVASLALTLALATAGSSTGHAVMATPEQAAEMAQVIELRMTEWFTPEDDEDAEVEWYGPVKVEAEGERYVVHLPPSSVTGRERRSNRDRDDPAGRGTHGRWRLQGRRTASR